MTAARIDDYDPRWPVIADAAIGELRRALAPWPVSRIDHIGSTAVPGLAAKPVIDLQVLVDELPSDEELTAAIGALGWIRATGARPDSPGVHVDTPRPGHDPDPALHRKSLWVARSGTDGAGIDMILHVRLADSPFAAFVLAFRDHLRASPADADAYATVKRRLAAAHADDVDYDDYTRAKSAFMDEIQARFDRSGR